MSFDINWDKLDNELAGYVQQFLNRHFQTINKPAFIGDIHVTSFDWGTTAPSIEIVDITDPFPEFYEPEEMEDDIDQDMPKKAASSNTMTSLPPSSARLQSQASSTRASDLPLSSSPTNLVDPFFDSLENSSKQQYSEVFSYPGTPQQQQHQRIQLMHSFHRSPLVAPQHPFNHTMPSTSRSASYFSPGPTSPSTSSYFDQRFASARGKIQDWMDEEEKVMKATRTPASSVSSPPQTQPSPSPPLSSLPSVSPSSAAIHPIGSTTTKVATLHQKEKTPTHIDFQAHLLISYKGDMSMTILTELRMNYPSMVFMSLPIQLCVRSVEFEATAVVAYIQSMNRVCVSMLETEDEELVSVRGKNAGGLESLLRQVQIESVVGDKQKHVLKNVGKIERFIVEQLRKMLDDELVFPSYQCVELG